jgi:CheY-like chemotaxis protein
MDAWVNVGSGKNAHDTAPGAVKLRGMSQTEPLSQEASSQELEIRSVLVLEDDVQQALLLKAILEDEDFMVTTVEHGVDGLREIMAFDFDAIVCDMMMPKMPGDMFYLAVSRAKPHLCQRFVFITGYVDDPKINEFMERVHGHVLHKPLKPDDLVRTIKRVAELGRVTP